MSKQIDQIKRDLFSLKRQIDSNTLSPEDREKAIQTYVELIYSLIPEKPQTSPSFSHSKTLTIDIETYICEVIRVGTIKYHVLALTTAILKKLRIL